MANTSTNNRTLVTLVVVVVAVAVFYGIATMPDKRNGAERLGDAIHELPNGADKAADQLKDRTPAQKVGDAIEDAGDNVKRQ